MSVRSVASFLRAISGRLALGALLGLMLFGAETLWLLRAGVVGVDIPLDGPYAALAAAVRPLLPGVILRVASVYAVAGALLGLAAAVLTRAWTRRGGWRALAWMVPHWLGLLSFWAWDRALARPALFDDLPAVRPVLAWLVDHGEPWQARAAAGAWVSVHLAVLAWRGARGLRRFVSSGGPAPLRAERAAWVVVAGVVGVLAVAVTVRRAGPSVRRPLVVLIGIDAFRPDRLGATGHGVAPQVERFLQDATLFTRAYTPVAQTEPAWRSLLTARWPYRTGVRYPLTPDARLVLAPTFAQHFAEAGWRTVFATDCSRFHFEGPASGFATRWQPPRGAINFALEKLRYRALGLFADNPAGAAWVPEFIDNRALAGIHDPMGYARRLSEGLVAEAGEGPLLFAFHATAAHFPGDPVYPFYRRYVSSSEPLERRLRMHFAPVTPGAKGAWSRAGAEGLYDELLAQADAQVGTLLDALRASGRYDDALIVLMSDHGESFHADRPDLAGATSVHGARLGDEENRILLAVKLPGGRGAGPAQVDALARLVDVGPTLLELSGLSALPESDGASLGPLLRGEGRPLTPLYAETGYTHVVPEVFDPGHRPGAPRTFDAYRLRPDGVVEMGDEAGMAVLREKDTGAFDGERWVVDRPQADGTVRRTCTGDCEGADARALADWLDDATERAPEPASRRVAGHVDDRNDSRPPGNVRPPQRLLRVWPGQPQGAAHPQPRGG
ncbi:MULTISPECIES: sulfatase-like hydrolase/transferase [unclassified Corallococcus]|uniref:sulfatase-like hydrolase/transferase n=1 Tax=unclassified Corallococcus TaxID=2685029 RepID=UPI001A8C84DF|nr:MULTISPECIES: sulfatase-like hydrolase/transferase [unclassified Corallococcus]MBN9684081.1 sulfatase-like hydrolase/transferase [Corallococcus sp. NCSPR001]WAS84427.1 sulfatase-like hydrolase/transferase [Corallococcus sp. NCRR]